MRLHGIECPERRQPFGTRARQSIGDLAFGKTVTVRLRDVDRYGRLLGEVILPDGRNLNHEVVKAGLACWYRRYAPDDAELARPEREARKAGRGLWADKAPVPPWEGRRSARTRDDGGRQRPRALRRSRL